MTYEEIIRYAAAKCEEWFISNPDYFHNKARLIAERREAWEKESRRLNPKVSLTYFDKESGIWFPDEHRCFPERKEPSVVDPILVCVGKYKFNEKITRTPIPSDKDDALLVYVAALLILHDGMAAKYEVGYRIITENIWPKEWLSVINFFDHHVTTNDRSDFIEAALRHVKADIDSHLAPKNSKEQTPAASGGSAGDGKNGGQSIDSQNKQEDIIELKPNVCGVGLNINALIRKIKCWIKNKKST